MLRAVGCEVVLTRRDKDNVTEGGLGYSYIFAPPINEYVRRGPHRGAIGRPSTGSYEHCGSDGCLVTVVSTLVIRTKMDGVRVTNWRRDADQGLPLPMNQL